VPHESLLNPERRADIINQRSIGVPKAVPAHSLQSDLFTCWSQVVFLNGIAVDRAFRIGISEYARRPPIAQRRMIGISKYEIKFLAKDRRMRTQVIVRLTPKEFLDAWMQHITRALQTRGALIWDIRSGNWENFRGSVRSSRAESKSTPETFTVEFVHQAGLRVGSSSRSARKSHDLE
jgi:hypothetical protein